MGGATAVDWAITSLSFLQLDALANAVALKLVARGALPDSAIALQLKKSLEMAVGILGVLCSGACYLPLDPAWPLERRVFIVDDTNAQQLIVSPLEPAVDLQTA